MKILYIACGSGCDQTMGGSLSRSIEIAHRLSKKHRVAILTTTGGKSAVTRVYPSFSVFEFLTPLCKIHNERYFFVKQFISYILILLETVFLTLKLPTFDIVYLDSDGLWDIIPALAYKIKNPASRIVSMNHHKITLRREGKKSLVLSFINIVMQRASYLLLRFLADALLVLDTHMGDVIREEFGRLGYRKRIYPVKDGVDSGSIQKVPAQKIMYDACFFGYLRPSKGLYDIVPIWIKVVKSIPDARLIIIGGMLPDYRSHLTDAIRKNNLQDNIILQDYMPDKNEAIRVVKQSKIFISPSHEEGWGISIMECLAAGVPGVVWDLPTYDRIFDKGLIKIVKWNINTFSKAAIDLLRNKRKYAQLKSQTAGSVDNYSWEKIARDEEQIFNTILKS